MPSPPKLLPIDPSLPGSESPLVSGMRYARADFAVGVFGPDEIASTLYSELAERSTFVKWYEIEYEALEASEEYARLALEDSAD